MAVLARCCSVPAAAVWKAGAKTWLPPGSCQRAPSPQGAARAPVLLQLHGGPSTVTSTSRCRGVSLSWIRPHAPPQGAQDLGRAGGIDMERAGLLKEAVGIVQQQQPPAHSTWCSYAKLLYNPGECSGQLLECNQSVSNKSHQNMTKSLIACNQCN